MGDGKRSESGASFGVYDSFRYPLPVKMSHFFMQNKILQQEGTTGSCAHGILIIVIGNTGCGG